jgi:Family of unknown function (DUF6328)
MISDEDDETTRLLREIGDRPLSELDDDADRDELRSRYYGLLQELRVILPGVQVLLGFLLTVPFAQRFASLDRSERVAYGIALFAAFMSVICLLTPAVFHRVGERTARSARLRWGIRMTLSGLALLAVALLAGLWSVTEFVFGSAWARGVVAVGVVSLLSLWIALPLAVGHNNSPRVREDPHR